MDILARMRTMTPESPASVPSTFDDLPKGHFRAAKVTGMVRIVEGADDLVHAGPRNSTPGMVKIPTDAELAQTGHNGDTCNNPRCCPVAPGSPRDARSERQIELMRDLMKQLADLDAATAEQAAEYTTKMTLHGAWTAGREGNASRWIGNMIKKVRELRAAKAEANQAVKSEWLDIPTGYYALRDGDSVKFYRVNHHDNGRTYVDAMASDDRHPIRNAVHKKNILTAIRAMGWEASTALYGQEIGSCGRCGRTLTDDVSRAAGIGPKCRKDM